VNRGDWAQASRTAILVVIFAIVVIVGVSVFIEYVVQ
jgi:hypothetical protein